jgi:hypothetical protein
MSNLNKITATNDLRYTTTVTSACGNDLIIKIRLNDECNNGHQDFSITGDIYKKGLPRVDRNFITGGYIHDEILKACPGFKIFIDLHLCDFSGVPMHAVSNMLYHLKNGFNKTKTEDENFKAEFCEYYRINLKHFEELTECENEVQFYLKLKKLDILNIWETQAAQGIKLLEELTGQTIEIDSKRSNLVVPSKEQLKEEAEKQKSGYYSAEQKQKRIELARQKEFKVLEDEYNKKIKKHKLEYTVKKEVLTHGGKKALDNCIFYNHANTLAFNWKSWDNLTDNEVNTLIEKMKLPNGVKVENAKGK